MIWLVTLPRPTALMSTVGPSRMPWPCCVTSVETPSWIWSQWTNKVRHVCIVQTVFFCLCLFCFFPILSFVFKKLSRWRLFWKPVSLKSVVLVSCIPNTLFLLFVLCLCCSLSGLHQHNAHPGRRQPWLILCSVHSEEPNKDNAGAALQPNCSIAEL